MVYYWLRPFDRGDRYAFAKGPGVSPSAIGPDVFEALNAAYHVEPDPAEQHPRPVASAPTHLRERAESVRTTVDSVPSLDGDVDDETSGTLRALGYL